MKSVPPSQYDLWYGRARIAAMQSLGMADLVWQFFFVPSAQPILVAAGAVLLGIPVTRLIDKALE